MTRTATLTAILLAAMLAGCTTTPNEVQLLDAADEAVDADNDGLLDHDEVRLCLNALTASFAAAVDNASCDGSDLDVDGLESLFFVETPLLGADRDGDGIPSTVQLRGVELNLGSGELSPKDLLSAPLPLDPDDADADIPEGGRTMQYESPFPIPYGRGPSIVDSDQDRIPGVFTTPAMYIGVQDMTLQFRQGPDLRFAADRDDQDPNVPVHRISWTTQEPVALYPTIGPDHDNDGVPQYINIHRAFLRFHVTTAESSEGFITLVDAGALTIRVTQSGEAESHLSTLDPDDSDPDTPAPTGAATAVSIPIWMQTTGDGDGDGIPAGVDVIMGTVSIDRTARAPVAWHETSRVHIDVDPDDTDDTSPVPVPIYDEDMDLLPDSLEAWFCGLNDPNDPLDGVCVRPDGSGIDGTGVNLIRDLYVTATDAAPVDVHDELDGGIGNQNAPGAALWTTLVLLGAAVVLRRSERSL